jgi:hypothetical protein
MGTHLFLSRRAIMGTNNVWVNNGDAFIFRNYAESAGGRIPKWLQKAEEG